MIRLKLSGLFFIILTITGCIGRTPLPVPVIDRDEKDAVIRAIQTESEKLTSLKASGRLSITYEGMYNNFKFAAVFQQPDRCRIDTYVLFGKLAASTVISGDSLLSYSPMTNEFMAMSLDDPSLMERIPLPINLSEVSGLLATSVTLPPAESVNLVTIGKEYQLEWQNDDLIYRAGYHRQKLYLKKLEVSDGDRLLIETEFLQYKNIDGIYRPRQINFERMNTGDKISLSLKRQKVNAAISPTAFKLSLPRNAQRIVF